MSDKYTYTEQDFKDGKARKTYSDTDDHITRISNTIYSLKVKDDDTQDAQITEYNSGIGITVIDNDCFNNCRNLEKVTIRDNVRFIGDNAFKDCINLSSMNLEGITYRYIGRNAFNNTGLNVLCISYQLDPTLTKNISCVYANCGKLSAVQYTSNYLPISSFANCQNLKDVSVFFQLSDEYRQHGITFDGHQFDNCKNLSCVRISGDNVSIPSKLICNCPNLQKFDTYGNNMSLNDCVFENCKNLTYVKFRQGVTLGNIKGNALSGSNIEIIRLMGVSSTDLMDFFEKPRKLTEEVPLDELFDYSDSSQQQLGIKDFDDSIDNFKYGKLYTHAARVLDYGLKNNIPVVMIDGDPTCSTCHQKMEEGILRRRKTYTWLGKLPCLICFPNSTKKSTSLTDNKNGEPVGSKVYDDLTKKNQKIKKNENGTPYEYYEIESYSKFCSFSYEEKYPCYAIGVDTNIGKVSGIDLPQNDCRLHNMYCHITIIYKKKDGTVSGCMIPLQYDSIDGSYAIYDLYGNYKTADQILQEYFCSFEPQSCADKRRDSWVNVTDRVTNHVFDAIYGGILGHFILPESERSLRSPGYYSLIAGYGVGGDEYKTYYEYDPLRVSAWKKGNAVFLKKQELLNKYTCSYEDGLKNRLEMLRTIIDRTIGGYTRDSSLNPPGFDGEDMEWDIENGEKFTCWGVGHDCEIQTSDGIRCQWTESTQKLTKIGTW